MKIEEVESTKKWTKYGKNFVVELAHRFDGNFNIWNLYAYIYPEHKLFKKISCDKDVDMLPMHGGITYFRFVSCHENKDVFSHTAIQVGCDYHHYGDDRYQRKFDDDITVFAGDIDALVNALTETDGNVAEDLTAN
ncbi:MAG: hypothetical protein LBK60_03170 [Verrucomicrobiales bacterium]|jgi:hypothetical protein|nr:hypothetical protein [Verrucomicrobiales bacterium]